MTKTINGKMVGRNEEGYLTNLAEWNKEVAVSIATEEGIEMTPKHWDVVQYLQVEHMKKTNLTIRRIGKSGIVTIKEFYALFPNGPLKKASKIAGIPKPVSCI